MKPGRVLVGVCSCRKNAAQRYAIRRTWAKKIPGHVRVEFFVGVGPQPCEAGVWELACEELVRGTAFQSPGSHGLGLGRAGVGLPLQVR